VNLPKRFCFCSATVAAAIVAFAATTVDLQHRAEAADYPAGPITLIVPYPAGGGNDVIARLVAAKMSASLGEPIVIENRGGAGSTIGARDAVRSAPDGYTLLFDTSSLAINPSLYPDAAYDPKKDLAPIGLIATSPNFLLVNPAMPVHSVAELIALAKKEPGKLDFASTGTGTSTHLAALLFAMMADVKFTAVPYKGVAPAITDLLGGQVALMFCPMASVVGRVRGGNLRAIAMTGVKRSPLFPNVPTVAEAGLPGYAAELHYGLAAPAGTPPEVIAKLNAALNNALADGDIRKRLAADGTETLPGTPESYAAEIASEEAKWGAIIKSAGVNLAFAAGAAGTGDATNSGIDSPGLDVTRQAMPPPDITKPAESATVSANPLWAIPLNALAATRNRPLFTPSRRPPAPIVASTSVVAPRPPPPPPAPEHSNLVLVGTVAAGSEGLAVLIDPMSHNAVRLRTGEGHRGWILQSVDRRTATLQKGGQSEMLELPRPTSRP
jgi:tripartite-type tricarboxylate transporter receptor subunit TctC